ncbi:MAG: MoaD/ThiS family protein [Bacteroidota bacterium]
MTVKVLFFGPAADAAGRSELVLEGAVDTDELRQRLLGLFPKLRQLGFLMAVNKQVVQEKAVLGNQDVVAVLPPYSGG